MSFKVSYEECKYMWDRCFRHYMRDGEMDRLDMIKHAAEKCGVKVQKHPEINRHALKYLEERRKKAI